MNYQHSYHAGCAADVFKHIILIQLLKMLQKKPSAFTYIDSHAGDALYSLQSNAAQKTKEYKEGIARIWQENSDHPLLADYWQVLRTFNPDQQLQFYPGSGLIAKQFLREQDHAILCELHTTVAENLAAYFHRDKQISVHRRDGYEALPGLVPPKTQRGLVLIDPPYEATDEFDRIIDTLVKMQTRWPNGTYAVWFPIKQYQAVLNFYHTLKKLYFPNILTAECWTKPNAEDNKLKGSGLVIINPPWQFDSWLRDFMPVLAHSLRIEKNGKTKVQWLVNHD